MARNASATKSGPGRRHQQGHRKSVLPTVSGAGFGFVQHTADTARLNRRKSTAAIGARQLRRLQRAARIGTA